MSARRTGPEELGFDLEMYNELTFEDQQELLRRRLELENPDQIEGQLQGHANVFKIILFRVMRKSL